MKPLPRTIVALGVVSLLTDLSSEMIYPLLPAFLVTLGAGGAFVGLIEGIADATSALLKLASGYWADRVKRKKPLVVLGYAIASLARPLVAVARAPWHVLVVRFSDRIGKGIRTSPRDALIAEATPEAVRGRAFGFHRAMDHAGALIGPLVAYALLHTAGMTHRTIFALALIPAAFAIFVLITMVSEHAIAPTRAIPERISPSATTPTPKPEVRNPDSEPRLPKAFWLYLSLLTLFTLGNSTDFFLLLRAQDAGVAPETVPLLWAALHAVKAALSTPFGSLSDRLGRRRVIVLGWLVYAAVYLGFSLVSSAWQVWTLFLCYGAHFALVEGAEKALVVDLTPPAARGRAFGFFHFVIGICALPASLGFGLLWQYVGHGAAFVAGASLAGAAALGLLVLRAAPASAPRGDDRIAAD